MRMQDVARRLGISTMTVSRALRTDTTVAPDTREAVLKAIEELGFVPNQIAGSLSSKRSGFAAILVPSLNSPHFSETVLALNEALAPKGIQLLIGNTEYCRTKEESLLRAFLARKPEAVVLTSDGHTAALGKLLARAKVPVVQIWGLPEKPLQHVVGFSNRTAMYDLVTRVMEMGYSRITYLGESQDEGTRGAERRFGYLDAMKARGISPRLCRVGPPPAKMSDGEAGLNAMLESYPDTELVVCVSDPLAFGVISACTRRGLAVPEQMAVCGFGDFEIARVANPAITTVGIDAGDIGRQAARLILANREEQAPPARSTVMVPYAVHIRASAPGR